MKKFYDIQNKKWGLYVLIILEVCLFIFEIMRINRYCLTWDEALTYRRFVVPVFHNNEGLKNLLHPLSDSAANSHLLNTALIGFFDTITGIKYNEYVIRFPVFLFFLLFLYICMHMYIKNVLSFVETVMLLLCYYMNEFFSLARGYAMAAVLIIIGIYYWKYWQDTGRDSCLLKSVLFFSLAEVANTVSLLVIAPFYIFIFFAVLKEKRIWVLLKKHFVEILSLLLINIFMVRYHFYISQVDTSLYCNMEGGALKNLIYMIKEYFSLLTPYRVNMVIGVYVVLFFLCFLAVIRKRDSVKILQFTFLWGLYLLITLCSVVVTGKGFPMGRTIIPGYPLFVLSFGELIKNFYIFYIKTENKYKAVQCLTNICVLVILVLSFIKQVNLTTTRDWSNSQYAKKWTYQVYNDRIKVTEDYFETYSESIRFYREQILYKYGYDIYQEE